MHHSADSIRHDICGLTAHPQPTQGMHWFCHAAFQCPEALSQARLATGQHGMPCLCCSVYTACMFVGISSCTFEISVSAFMAYVHAGSADSVGAPPSKNEFSLQRIASTMEIIDPRDITLVKFLGSGGYGEVHLGKWHSSEAAIKCLNPSLFFQVSASILNSRSTSFLQ